MAAARRWVVHVWSIVAAIIAAISSQVPGSGAKLPSILLWFCGCLAILGLGAYWVRVRHAATHGFLARIQSGTLDLERVEITGLSILTEALRFGYEVDLYLRSGERLAFGFWTRADAGSLLDALQPGQPMSAREASVGLS